MVWSLNFFISLPSLVWTRSPVADPAPVPSQSCVVAQSVARAEREAMLLKAMQMKIGGPCG